MFQLLKAKSRVPLLVLCSATLGCAASTHAEAFDDEPAAAFFAREAPALALNTSPQATAPDTPVAMARVPAFSAGGGLRRMVTEAAIRHRVPVALAHGVVKAESNYNCRAHSRSGATGIMQTLRATAAGVGVSGPLTDCATGLEAGMRYLKLALDTHGAGCAGASAYERGVRAPGRCTAYGRKVLQLAAQG